MNVFNGSRRRRWPRFHLRTLLGVILLLAVLLAGFNSWRDAKRRQRLAAEAILDRHCSVAYIDGRPIHQRGKLIKLLATILPEECLQTVIWADFPRDATDEELALLVDLPDLQTLHLTDAAQVTTRGLKHLSGLRDLRVLDLKKTPVGDAGLVFLQQQRMLTEMWLSQTCISDASIPWIAGNRELTHLDLQGAAITDKSLVLLANLKKLEVLSLGETLVTSQGLEFLRRFPRLAHLYLAKTSIDDAGLKLLESVPTLQTLDVRYTRITAAGRDHFKRAIPRCRLEE